MAWGYGRFLGQPQEEELDFAAMTDEELGIAPLGLDTTSEAMDPQSGMQRFLGGFAGLENQPQRAPRGFGEGLVGGFSQGLGRSATRSQTERAKQELGIQQRQRERNAANLKATESYAERRTKAFQELNKTKAEKRKEEREAAEAAAKLDLEQPLVDATLKAKYPALAGMPDGQRLAKGMLEEVQKRDLPPKPETPAEKRAAAAGERAEATARLQADTAARQARLAQVQTVGGLADDYRMDKAIAGYQAVRSNLNTAETGAKLNSGPGDIALIFSYMRALEPENPNAVREGEFDNAQKATGLLQTAVNLPKQYFQGNRLTELGRKHFLEQMRATLKGRRPDYEMANDQYKRRAEAGGVDPTLFIRDFAEPEAPKQRPSLSGIYGGR